jgi:hypothetical protein
MSIKLNDDELLQNGIFTEEEESAVICFIRGTMHLEEFTNLVMHCYNFNNNPSASIAPLLRYVDMFQIEGLFLFLRCYHNHKGIQQIISEELFSSIISMKKYQRLFTL